MRKAALAHMRTFTSISHIRIQLSPSPSQVASVNTEIINPKVISNYASHAIISKKGKQKSPEQKASPLPHPELHCTLGLLLLCMSDLPQP